MKTLIGGIILGSLMTGGLVAAGTFYDSKGKPNVPSGLIQQMDYFRFRQQMIDINAMRRQVEKRSAQSTVASLRKMTDRAALTL
jgi:hypothetical protein